MARTIFQKPWLWSRDRNQIYGKKKSVHYILYLKWTSSFYFSFFVIIVFIWLPLQGSSLQIFSLHLIQSLASFIVVPPTITSMNQLCRPRPQPGSSSYSSLCLIYPVSPLPDRLSLTLYFNWSSVFHSANLLTNHSSAALTTRYEHSLSLPSSLVTPSIPLCLHPPLHPFCALVILLTGWCPLHNLYYLPSTHPHLSTNQLFITTDAVVVIRSINAATKTGFRA